MDFRKHPPMVTPLISAAALMLMGGFLIHRIHPGGIGAALRGEKPKSQRTVTIVPSVLPEPDPVAWGEQGLIQVGLRAPPRHGPVGPLWMGLCLRNTAQGPVGLASGMVPGGMGSSRIVVRVSDGSGASAEWLVPPGELSFNLRLPGEDQVVLPFLLPEPPGIADARSTNSFTVSVAIKGVVITAESGSIGPVDIESGGVVLARCWSLGRQAGPKGGDDGLGLSPGDIQIPVPPAK
jgi:hypothetical protein